MGRGDDLPVAHFPHLPDQVQGGLHVRRSVIYTGDEVGVEVGAEGSEVREGGCFFCEEMEHGMLYVIGLYPDVAGRCLMS